jgi:hypothetical protein
MAYHINTTISSFCPIRRTDRYSLGIFKHSSPLAGIEDQ